MPYHATLGEAASPPPALAVVGIGTLAVMPAVPGYVVFAHWVFRGKTDAEAGYGD